MRNGSKKSKPDSHRFSNHDKKIITRFAYILNNCKRNLSICKKVREKFKLKKRCITPLAENKACPTLTTLPDDYIHYNEPRILTVREYARIQSFDDWFEFRGNYTTGGKLRIKDVPRYSQVGNAIPPLFGEQSGRVFKEMLS
jgi:DNA (cytosine-5)-methyltransferase 1